MIIRPCILTFHCCDQSLLHFVNSQVKYVYVHKSIPEPIDSICFTTPASTWVVFCEGASLCCLFSMYIYKVKWNTVYKTVVTVYKYGRGHKSLHFYYSIIIIRIVFLYFVCCGLHYECTYLCTYIDPTLHCRLDASLT